MTEEMEAEAAPLRTAHALDAAFSGTPARLVEPDGTTTPFRVEHWRAAPGSDDRILFLDHCTGRTLDVGCGPGRLVADLCARGVTALGIDISAEAVRQARERGARAMRGDIFSLLPGVGSWDHALLADGNVGIGGDPARLLARVRELLRAGGTATVEVGPHGTGLVTRRLQLQVGTSMSRGFHWSSVGADAIGPLAEAAGFTLDRIIEVGDRQAAVLVADED